MQALAFYLYYSTHKITDIRSIIKVLIIIPIFLMWELINSSFIVLNKKEITLSEFLAVIFSISSGETQLTDWLI